MGTTTVAVNVATTLARLVPGSTLLVDLHVANGDAAVFLGAEPRFSIVDALENTHRLDEAFFRNVIVKTKAGVDLLASSERMMTSPLDVRRIRTLLEMAERHYRYVVLDIPVRTPRSSTRSRASSRSSSSPTRSWRRFAAPAAWPRRCASGTGRTS